MKISKVRIKNYRSIKDSKEIDFNDKLFVLAGQNESGKSSILEALQAYEKDEALRDTLNFELEEDDNLVQEISCTYSNFNKSFFEGIIDGLKEEKIISSDFVLKNVFDEKIISDIVTFTITKSFNFENSESDIQTKLDKSTLGKLRKHCKSIQKNIEGEDGKQTKIKEPIIDFDTNENQLAKIFFRYTPKIILFNDFSSLLPDKITLGNLENEEAEGYSAVKSLEKLLNSSFEKIANKSDRQRRSATDKESQVISANFQNDWRQKIYGNNKVRILFDIQNNDEGQKEIIFSVVTKDNENLAPRKRSKGMIWFLSLWLELKSKENDVNLIILFDEPGLHLHIKANKDMLTVFHKLTNKGHQIIYSTHSPSLIETDKLYNIGLVINTEKYGTLVEGLTTVKINSENKKDALQPIAEAMGLEPLKDFSVLKKKNVLLEGISDFWILKGFLQLIKPKSDFEFIPGVGIKGNQIKPLISFCIGYGLDWLLIMDNGELPNKIRNEMKLELFNNEETITKTKIKLINEKEIENLFNFNDIILVNSSLRVPNNIGNKKPIDIIGKRNKVLFAKQFFTKVNSGEIKKDNINQSTLDKFNEIFIWINKQFK